MIPSNISRDGKKSDLIVIAKINYLENQPDYLSHTYGPIILCSKEGT
jgi:hypothetical protein